MKIKIDKFQDLDDATEVFSNENVKHTKMKDGFTEGQPKDKKRIKTKDYTENRKVKRGDEPT